MSTEPKHPHRVWRIKDGECRGMFRESHHKNIETEEYLSLSEHTELLREARAKVWEEAAWLATPASLDNDYALRLIKEFQNKAKEARSGAKEGA